MRDAGVQTGARRAHRRPIAPRRFGVDADKAAVWTKTDCRLVHTNPFAIFDADGRNRPIGGQSRLDLAIVVPAGRFRHEFAGKPPLRVAVEAVRERFVLRSLTRRDQNAIFVGKGPIQQVQRDDRLLQSCRPSEAEQLALGRAMRLRFAETKRVDQARSMELSQLGHVSGSIDDRVPQHQAPSNRPLKPDSRGQRGAQTQADNRDLRLPRLSTKLRSGSTNVVAPLPNVDFGAVAVGIAQPAVVELQNGKTALRQPDAELADRVVRPDIFMADRRANQNGRPGTSVPAGS